MSLDHSLKKLSEHEASMFQQGFLDDDQFRLLQKLKLKDESYSDPVVYFMTMFFEDSEILLGKISRALQQVPPDFKQVKFDALKHKGASASVGAARVENVCGTFSEAQDLEGCVQCLQQLQQEYSLLKNNLKYLFKLQKEIKAAARDGLGGNMIAYSSM